MTLEEALWQDPGRCSGAVCFRGTRIMVSILFDYLVSDGLASFYEGYPDVGEDQVAAVIEACQAAIDDRFLVKMAA